MSDLISRQTENKFERTINASDLQEWIMTMFPDWCEGDIRLIFDHIDKMPSAQPEERTEERTETHGVCLDAIDRQAAIDAMCAWFFNLSDNRRIDEVLNEVPSAQPEVLACGEGELIAQPEIIRCKDCKHSRFFDPCFYCYEFGGEIIVSENGYCYKAERRTDET